MSWTNIPNANLAIGAPIRSIDQLALRDNPIAIAEGATGAPRVRAEALNGGQSGSAPIFAARAWVNFNGTGTVAIRASGNVSSVVKNAVGNFTVNFTTAMPDAHHVANYSMDNSIVAGDQFIWVENLTSTSVDVKVFNNGFKDPVTNMISIFR
jgi:hypothetical protein